MRLRLLLFSLFLFATALASRASDTVTIKVTHFGLEGIYVNTSEPTWVEITARNNTNQSIAFNLVVSELTLEATEAPISETVALPLNFAPAETRAVDVPLHIVQRNYAVIYAQALDAQEAPLGRTGMVVPPIKQGDIIALLCSTPDVCRAIRQSILLSGSPEEQTNKSNSLRLIQLSKAPSQGWAYSAARVAILAMPVAQLSPSQRDALEAHLRTGGELVLVDDQLADAASSADHSRFLDAYRNHAGPGKGLRVGEGELVRMPSVTSREFSDHFRPFGFTPNTPAAVRKLFARSQTVLTVSDPDQPKSWVIRRLGTRFRFPSFLGLLAWIVSYLVLVGVVNFLFLRRIGHPDWAWLTIPALALLFSAFLYAVSARNHPRNFGLDEITAYRLDDRSPMATVTSHVRVSAPERSLLRLVLPGDLIEGTGRRQQGLFAIDVPQFSFEGGAAARGDIQLGNSWEASFSLLRWSFRDFQFVGQRKLSGTIYRDSSGRLHNETGLTFRQALVADPRDVFYLSEFPAGAVVDLAHVPHRPYEEEAGLRTSNAISDFPGPPFPFKPLNGNEVIPGQSSKRGDEEYKAQLTRPFAISELIRGWPEHGDNVFSETKAVFFGLSSDGSLGAALRDRTPDRNVATLMIVTFEDWP